MRREDCIFCNIASGKIPSFKIYEDKYVVAFLDNAKDFEGHTLVVTKQHYDNFINCPVSVVKHIAKITQKISKHYQKLGYDGVNVTTNCNECAGQEVFHLHYHIIPRKNGDKKKLYSTQSKNEAMDLESIYKTHKISRREEKKPNRKKFFSVIAFFIAFSMVLPLATVFSGCNVKTEKESETLTTINGFTLKPFGTRTTTIDGKTTTTTKYELVTVDKTMAGNKWNSETGTLTIPKEISSIGTRCFENDNDIKRIVIEEDGYIETIRAFAFNGCSQLISVNCGEFEGHSVLKSIEMCAFMNCTNLSGFDFSSEKLSSIGHLAFYKCPLELNNGILCKGTRLNDSWTTDAKTSDNGDISFNKFYIAKDANNNYVLLRVTKINIEDSRVSPTIDIYKAFRVENDSFDLNINNYRIMSVKAGAFAGTQFTQISVSANEIQDYAFNDCVELVTCILGQGKSIGYKAFAGCEELITLKLSVNDLSEIKVGAFMNCTKLGEMKSVSTDNDFKNSNFKVAHGGLRSADGTRFVRALAKGGGTIKAGYYVWDFRKNVIDYNTSDDRSFSYDVRTVDGYAFSGIDFSVDRYRINVCNSFESWGAHTFDNCVGENLDIYIEATARDNIINQTKKVSVAIDNSIGFVALKKEVRLFVDLNNTDELTELDLGFETIERFNAITM